MEAKSVSTSKFALHCADLVLIHSSMEKTPQVGHSVHIDGIARLDIEDCSANTLYVTVWASPLLPLHMGKQRIPNLFWKNRLAVNYSFGIYQCSTSTTSQLRLTCLYYLKLFVGAEQQEV